MVQRGQGEEFSGLGFGGRSASLCHWHCLELLALGYIKSSLTFSWFQCSLKILFPHLLLAVGWTIPHACPLGMTQVRGDGRRKCYQRQEAGISCQCRQRGSVTSHRHSSKERRGRNNLTYLQFNLESTTSSFLWQIQLDGSWPGYLGNAACRSQSSYSEKWRARVDWRTNR